MIANQRLVCSASFDERAPTNFALPAIAVEEKVRNGVAHANYMTLCHIHHKIKPFKALEAPFLGQNSPSKERLLKWHVQKDIFFRKIIEEEDDHQLRDGKTGYGGGTQNLHYWELD